MDFHSVDTLTGRIVGTLAPNKWELTDPLRGSGTGTLTIPLPGTAAGNARLADATQRHNRWIAAFEDDQFLWCGPIVRRPAKDGQTIIVPVADWRSWFYRASIRPNPDGSRRNYYRGLGGVPTDQATICTDLMGIGLDATGAPPMIIDSPPDTGSDVGITALMLDKAIAEHLDALSAAGEFDWWVYCTQAADPTYMELHAAVCWPERAYRSTPIKLEYQLGDGGNVHDYSWPEGQDAPTKVWALGQGEPPDQVYSSDEWPGVEDGTETLWETTIGPLDGVSRTADAFARAQAAVRQSHRFDSTAEFTVAAERLPLTAVRTGDRARIVVDDGWSSVDIAAARIVSRVMSGGRSQPTTQRLIVDLSDAIYPGDPGEDIDDS